MHDNIDLDNSFQKTMTLVSMFTFNYAVSLNNGFRILGNNDYSLFMPKD